jgi:hypothetical protein
MNVIFVDGHIGIIVQVLDIKIQLHMHTVTASRCIWVVGNERMRSEVCECYCMEVDGNNIPNIAPLIN